MMSREERRRAEALERRARQSRQWGAWRRTDLPNGGPGRGAWVREVRVAYGNDLYAVLVRPLPSGITHCMIRTTTNLEPPWRDLQRIKNELFGPERAAVQVCPPQSRLVDEADLYHLWILPEGASIGFGLHPEDEVAA